MAWKGPQRSSSSICTGSNESHEPPPLPKGQHGVSGTAGSHGSMSALRLLPSPGASWGLPRGAAAACGLVLPGAGGPCWALTPAVLAVNSAVLRVPLIISQPRAVGSCSLKRRRPGDGASEGPWAGHRAGAPGQWFKISVLRGFSGLATLNLSPPAARRTFAPWHPPGSRSLGGHPVRCSPLAAARLLPAAACRRTVPVWLSLPEGFPVVCHLAHHPFLLLLLWWHVVPQGGLVHLGGAGWRGALGRLAARLGQSGQHPPGDEAWQQRQMGQNDPGLPPQSLLHQWGHARLNKGN